MIEHCHSSSPDELKSGESSNSPGPPFLVQHNNAKTGASDRFPRNPDWSRVNWRSFRRSIQRDFAGLIRSGNRQQK
ncbi:hypothetical protein [Paraburkholderia sp. 40]|uniref:hypothetical protein n=1 Tax=Paraburkholderia sp. 40 TaxID=2991059 RepID=UPI003D2630FA